MADKQLAESGGSCSIPQKWASKSALRYQVDDFIVSPPSNEDGGFFHLRYGRKPIQRESTYDRINKEISTTVEAQDGDPVISQLNASLAASSISAPSPPELSITSSGLSISSSGISTELGVESSDASQNRYDQERIITKPLFVFKFKGSSNEITEDVEPCNTDLQDALNEISLQKEPSLRQIDLKDFALQEKLYLNSEIPQNNSEFNNSISVSQNKFDTTGISNQVSLNELHLDQCPKASQKDIKYQSEFYSKVTKEEETEESDEKCLQLEEEYPENLKKNVNVTKETLKVSTNTLLDKVHNFTPVSSLSDSSSSCATTPGVTPTAVTPFTSPVITPHTSPGPKRKISGIVVESKMSAEKSMHSYFYTGGKSFQNASGISDSAITDNSEIAAATQRMTQQMESANKTSMNLDPSNAIGKKRRPKPSKLREMNFWAPTSM